MEHQEFDDLSRDLAASGTRRGALGVLAGLLGLSLLGVQDAEGKTRQKRRRQRRRKRKDRRRSQPANRRGIRLTVSNPLPNTRAINVEFGFETRDRGDGQCCQGQAAYTLGLDQSREYTTEEISAYVWLGDQYFIRFYNPLIYLPSISWSIDGTPDYMSPTCCKPHGQDLGFADMAEFTSKRLDFAGRIISVTRLEDEPNYKSFHIMLMS